MPDDHHLTPFEPCQTRQDLGLISKNLEIALARLAQTPTRADLMRWVLAAIVGTSALVPLVLEVFRRSCL
jgi:hypothetical protein